METNRFRQSFFREFSQAQAEILRWKKFTLLSLLGQRDEDQLYFWVLGIRVSPLSMLRTVCVCFPLSSPWGGMGSLCWSWSCSWERSSTVRAGGREGSSCARCSMRVMLSVSAPRPSCAVRAIALEWGKASRLGCSTRAQLCAFSYCGTVERGWMLSVVGAQHFCMSPFSEVCGFLFLMGKSVLPFAFP